MTSTFARPIDRVPVPPAALSLTTHRLVRVTGIALTIVSVAAYAAAPVIGFETSTQIAVAAAAIALAGFLWSPSAGLVGIALLCTLDVPARIYAFDNEWLRYNTFNYALLVIGLTILPTLVRLRDTQSRWLLVFLVLLGIQLVPSTNRFLGLVTLMEVLAGFTLAACFLRGGRHRDVLRTLAYVNSIVAAACMLAYYVAPPEMPVNPNALSQVSIGALVSLALAASVPGVLRAWPVAGLLAALNFAIVLLSSSRGGPTVAFVLLLYLIVRAPRPSTKVYIAGMFAAAFIAGTIAFPDLYERTVEKWYRLVDADMDLAQASNYRTDIVLFGWDAFVDNPMGGGTGSFTEQSYESSAQLRQGSAAHSAWVKTMAENGLPGLVILFGYLCSFAVTGAQSRLPGVRSLGLLVLVVVTLAFVFSEFQSKSIWLLAAGATALLNRPRASAVPAQGRRRRPLVGDTRGSRA